MRLQTDMLVLKRTCEAGWVDFNGHMRDAYYVLVVSFANDQTMDELGLGPKYLKASGHTLYNIDTHIRYLKEAHDGDPLTVEMRLIDADDKRLHLHSVIRHDETGDALAVNESLLLHVDQLRGPRSAPFPPQVAELVKRRLHRDSGTPLELRAGHIGIKRK